MLRDGHCHQMTCTNSSVPFAQGLHYVSIMSFRQLQCLASTADGFHPLSWDQAGWVAVCDAYANTHHLFCPSPCLDASWASRQCAVRPDFPCRKGCSASRLCQCKLSNNEPCFVAQIFWNLHVTSLQGRLTANNTFAEVGQPVLDTSLCPFTAPCS